MPTNPQAPGVYVDFVTSDNQPIEGVATAVLAITGFTAKAEMLGNDGITKVSARNKPVLITSWDQYKDHFGGFIEGAYTPNAVKGFFDNGGKRSYVISVLHEGFIAASKIERSRLLHCAQQVIYSKSGEAVLLLQAKKGGLEGERLKVQIQHHPNDESLFDMKFMDGQDTIELENVTMDTDPPPHPQNLTIVPISKISTSQKFEAFNKKIEIEILKSPGDAKQKRPNAQPATALGNGEFWIQEIDTHITDAANALSSIRSKLEPLNKEKHDLKSFEKTKQEKKEELEAAVNELSRAKGEAKTNAANKKKALEEEVADLETKIADKSGKLKELSESLRSEQAEELMLSDQQMQWIKKKDAYPETLPLLIEGSAQDRTGLGALEAQDDVTLLCAPDIALAYEQKWISKAEFSLIQQTMYNHCARMKYRFAILDAPHDAKTPQQIRNWRLNESNHDTSYAALYYPWIEISDPLNPGRKKTIPPSGHIAGVYARTDDEQGVFKAPANEQIKGIIGVAWDVMTSEQETLNPEGINCIRKFPGRGILIWGARTLSTTDKSWKYINVRRLFNYVGASVDRATQWTVFEPNNEKLWAKVRRNISSFLRNVWRSGALYGSSPEEAFYVRCDETLNDNYTRSVGQMICEIGLRPVFPAEFVIFRISQWAGPGGDEG